MTSATTSGALGEANRLGALDGLRGVAILMVMIFHLVLVYPFSGTVHSLYYQLGGALWISIDLFFVLSGFLITGILLETKGCANFFSAFYARRTLRIFPLYYAVLIALFVLAPLLGLYDTPELRFVLDHQIWFWTYMTNWGFVAAGGARFFNVEWLALIHFWSLAVEEQFYMLWPLVVFLFSRSGLVRVCVLLIVGALCFRLTIFALGLPQGAAYTLTPARIDALALGGLLAIAARRPEAMAVVRRIAPWCLTVAAAFVIVIFVTRGGVWFADPWMNTIGFSILDFGWASALVMSLPGPRQAWMGPLLEARWLRLFGKYSYGLYILHHLILPHLSPAPFAAVLPETLGATAYVASSIAVFFVAAWLCWRLIESPFLELKVFFPYRRAPATAEPRIA